MPIILEEYLELTSNEYTKTERWQHVPVGFRITRILIVYAQKLLGQWLYVSNKGGGK